MSSQKENPKAASPSDLPPVNRAWMFKSKVLLCINYLLSTVPLSIWEIMPKSAVENEVIINIGD